MDPAYITPFINSVQNVFATMLQLPVTIGEPSIKSAPLSTYDVSGIIGISGEVTGSVVLSLPKDTAERLVQLFTGTALKAGTPDFADAIGELVNMISGNAKAGFPHKGKNSISCPSVIVGREHTVAMPKDTPCIVIPCTTDCGSMALEVALRSTPTTQAAHPAAASANA